MALKISEGSGATLASQLIDGEHRQLLAPVSLNPIPAGTNFIGLATTVVGTGLPAGANYIGLATAVVGNTVTVGSHDVTNAGTFAVQNDAATPTGANFIGLVTVANTVTVGSHAVTNAGTFAVQEDGQVRTSLELIDDIIFTDDAAFTPATSKVAAIGAILDDAATDTVNEGDIGAIRMSSDRRLLTDTQIVGQDANITVDLGATDNGVLDSIDTSNTAIQTAVQLIDNAISGNEMQVDVVAALPAGDNNIGNIDLASEIPVGSKFIGLVTAHVSNTVTVGSHDVTNAGTFATQIDAALPTGANWLGLVTVHLANGGSGGTSATDDSAFTVGAGSGTPVMGIYQSVEDSVDDNDVGVVGMTIDRHMKVNVSDALPTGANWLGLATVHLANGGAGGTSTTDDSAFTVGSGSGTPAMYLADETTPDSVDEGDVGVPRMTLTRKPYAVLTDATSENNAGVDGSGHLQVDIAADSVGIGGGTQYTEDDAAAANPVGNILMGVRDDVLSGQTTTDGDNIAARFTDKGEQYVKHADDITIADGGNSITVDNAGTFAVQVDAALPVGTNTIGKLAANSGVDIGDVDVLSLPAIPTGANWIGLATVHLANGGAGGTSATDDAAFTAGSGSGTPMMGFATADAVDSGDVGVVAMSTARAMHVLPQANDGVDIGDVDVASITGVTFANAAMQITGDEAQDAVDAGNPVKIGGRAQEPTAALEEVADNDRADAAFDRQGRLAVWMGYPVQSADINDSTSGDNTIVAAGGAGLRIAVLGYHIVSDGTTDIRWEDGAAGTAFTGQIPLQAREGIVAGYGFQPMWVGTANTLLNLELTAAVNVHGQVSYILMTD